MAGLLTTSSLSAFTFTLRDGEIEGALDTTITYGLGMRVQDRSRTNIGLSNGGTNNSINGDDGNLNYDQWDLYTNAYKSVMELELKWKNITHFSRVTSLYDFHVAGRNTRRTRLGKAARGALGHNVRLLDCYVQADGHAGDVGISGRVGEQVINWGESTFITDGLNVLNPVDVSKLRTAGAEIREALLPLPMMRLDVSFNENISMMAFWNWGWRETRVDPKGTYFSNNDYGGPGGDHLFLLATTSDRRPFAPFEYLTRTDDRDGADLRNFGATLRYYSPTLNNTEFAGYFAWYASRLPIVSLRIGEGVPFFKNPKKLVINIPYPDGLLGPDTPVQDPATRYFVDYPSDIKVVGLSANTTLGSVAAQAEYSFHWDQPLQLDASNNATLLGVFPIGSEPDDGIYKGYTRRAYSQLQGTFTHLLGPTFGADQWTVLYEVGSTWVHNMPKKSVLPLSTDGGSGAGGNPLRTEPAAFADSWAMGYRLLTNMNFLNAFAGVNLTPQLAFQHDLFGRLPNPIAHFIKDRMQVTLQVKGEYQRFSATLAYNTYFNGGVHNLLRDRDFLTISGQFAY